MTTCRIKLCTTPPLSLGSYPSLLLSSIPPCYPTTIRVSVEGSCKTTENLFNSTVYETKLKVKYLQLLIACIFYRRRGRPYRHHGEIANGVVRRQPLAVNLPRVEGEENGEDVW